VQRQRLMIRPSVTEEQVFHEVIAVNFCGERCARRSYELQPVPKPEPYQVISRKLVAANHAVQAQKNKYPLFPDLVRYPNRRLRVPPRLV
jgi:hypothetical protein